MIDIHCHILPEISDGPNDVEIAHRMLRQAKLNGVTYIAATAHYAPQNVTKLPEALSTIRDQASQHGIQLHATFEYNLGDILDSSEPLFTIGQESPYVLVDFQSPILPPAGMAALGKMHQRGYRMIIVHPEKLFSITSIPELERYREAGAILQINAASILPDAPSATRSMARKLLQKRMVSCIASDAHRDKGSRMNRMKEAWTQLAKEYSEQEAAQLLFINPQRMLGGKAPLALPPLAPSLWERLRAMLTQQ